jgi:hypothetical protein
MATDKKERYEVGYRKPPPHTRFQKGQSGNPRGRPRESKNWDTLIDQELSARVVVHKSGKRKTISKRAAIATQLVNKAVSGDLRSAQTLLDRAPNVQGPVEELPIGPDGKSIITVRVFQQVAQRILGDDN